MSDRDGAPIVVVGAGIIGASTALQLARCGQKVIVIDRLLPGNGCSFGNAGIIAVDHVAPLANLDTLKSLPKMIGKSDGPLRLHGSALYSMLPWFARFALAAMPTSFEKKKRALASLVCAAGDAWSRLRANTSLDSAYRDIGALYVYERQNASTGRSGRSQTQEGTYLKYLDEYGVRYTTLRRDELRNDYLPGLTDEVSHGRYFPDMASVVNPAAVVQKIMLDACDAGATLLRTSVERITPSSERGVDVITTDGTVRASKAVLCGGVHTKDLLHGLGVSIPLAKERGYHVVLRSPCPEVLPFPVSFVDAGFTCNPMQDGIRVAGIVEFGGREKPDWSRATMLATSFKRVFPSLGNVEVASKWVGERPTLPDYLPMIGAVPSVPDVFVGTGHQHLGLTLGPLTGELLAELVLAKPATIELTPFAVDRFSKIL